MVLNTNLGGVRRGKRESIDEDNEYGSEEGDEGNYLNDVNEDDFENGSNEMNDY